MNDNDYLYGGWKDKYIITKADGSPVDRDAIYFVLRLDEDPNARVAAAAYAKSVREMGNAQLADDIMLRLSAIHAAISIKARLR